MTFATLIIIVGVGLGSVEIKINFEDITECHKAMDNFYFNFYRDIDRRLILPQVKVSCKTRGTPPAAG